MVKMAMRIVYTNHLKSLVRNKIAQLFFLRTYGAGRIYDNCLIRFVPKQIGLDANRIESEFA